VPHGLPQGARAGVSPGFCHRARAGLAFLIAVAFVAAASSPALADQARRNEWWLRTLHVTNAWETTRGSGVTIAVLDTGVNPAQADLTGSVITGPDYTNSGRTAGGQFWGIHGTEVASLIAGHGHGSGQANGIIGVAPAARVLSVRVTLESNDPQLTNQAIAAGLPGAIARGIRWAVRHGASVIDLPLDPVTTSGAPGSGGSPAEQAAVAYALAKHVVVVGPAGDGSTSGDPVNFPASYHGVIAVGAFDRHFVKAPFSSHRPYVTLTGPGAGVAAASPSGSYPQLNSTSAASAVVAGIVALIRAQFPALTPAQITRALTTSTKYHPPGGRADGSGFGTVDAARALIAAAGIAEAVSKPGASGSSSGQAPPTAPAVHSAPIHRNVRGTLIKDAVIAGLVFLLLLGLIFAASAWRRRHARSARLAEVRAAAQPPARRPAPGKGNAKKGALAGNGGPAPAAAPELEGAGFIAAPLGPAAGGPGPAGFTGSASPSFTGSAAGFTGSAAGFTGSAAGFTGSGFAGSASGFTGLASSGFTVAGTPPSVPAFPDLAAAAGPGSPVQPVSPPETTQPAGPSAPPGGVVLPAGLAAAAATGASAPPWARMQSDPHGAAIPDSAFGGTAFGGTTAASPAGAAASGTAPASGPAPAAGDGTVPSRPSSRLAQGPRQPRAPQVAGRPPWEPAPEPNSELPWAQAPASAQSPPVSLPHEQVRPAASSWEQAVPSWEELAQEAWPGGPKAAGPHPPIPPLAEASGRPGQQAGPAVTRAARMVPAAGLVPPQPDSPELARPTEDRPGYRWDPGAGVEPFRAQAGPTAAAGLPPASPAGGAVPGAAAAAGGDVAGEAEGAAAVSQPGAPGARRPSLALPRRVGSAADRQAGGASAPSRRPGRADAGPAGSASAGSASAGAGPAGAFSGAGSTAAGATSASWPGTGTSQPPFPPAPRPATDPGAPAGSQPEKGAFPRAIRPPMDPAAAVTSPVRAKAPDAGIPGAGTTGGQAPDVAGLGGLPATRKSQAAADAGRARAKQAGTGQAGAQAGSAFPAAKPATGTAPPKTGVPPWEITDSFLAIPAADAAGPAPAIPHAGPAPAIPHVGPAPAGPAAPAAPVMPGHSAASAPAADSAGSFPAADSGAQQRSFPRTDPADSTGSFPAADSGAQQRSFPRTDPGDSTESFPALRPRADIEDAFRLFPPARGTDNQPPADGQD
jgi:Subtilase family